MTAVKLASWNIRKCVGLDRRRDPTRVANVIASLEADVVALQEADKRLGKRPAALSADLIRRETGMEAVDLGGHEASLGWHGNALLIRPEIEVEARHRLRLPGLEPRGAIILDLKSPEVRLRVAAVHLGLLRQSRRAQLALIHREMAKLDHRPSVVLGDFNEWSKSKGLEALQDYDIHSPGQSFHAARPIAALDRIATGQGAEMRDAGVVETDQTRVASDHLPIWGRVACRVDENPPNRSQCSTIGGFHSPYTTTSISS